MTKNATTTPVEDVARLWAMFDPAKFFKTFGDLGNGFGLPGYDPKALMETQRLSVETWAKAQKQAMDGMQALARRQSELVRDGMKDMSVAMTAVTKAGSPSEAAQFQNEFAKTAFERFVEGSREMNELAVKANTEALSLLTARTVAAMDEMKTMAEKPAA